MDLVYPWVGAIVFQWLLYFVVCLGIYVLIFIGLKFQVGSLIDTRDYQPNQIRKEIMWGLLSCIVYGTVMAWLMNHTIAEPPQSLPLAAVQMVGFLFFYDFFNYFTHRLLHQPGWRRFHRLHHQSVRVTPWSTLSLNPVEALFNQLPYMVFVLVIPVSEQMLMVFYVWLMVGTAIGHSNYNPFANLSGNNFFRRYSEFHRLHHRYGQYNFGFMSNFWDFVFGTHYPAPSETRQV